MSKVQWLDRRLMDNPFFLGLCKSEDAFLREMRKLGIPKEKWPEWIRNEHSGATAHWFAHPKRGRIAIVCIRPGRRLLTETYALLVHEAVHIWQWIKEDIGEDEPSKEFEAYSIQRLSLNLMGAYRG
jgi:hypothetical protein